MSINVVIIAALALLVLIVLAMVLLGGGRKLTEGAGGCTANGGQCFDTAPPFDDPNWDRTPRDFTCPNNQRCYLYNYG